MAYIKHRGSYSIQTVLFWTQLDGLRTLKQFTRVYGVARLDYKLFSLTGRIWHVIVFVSCLGNLEFKADVPLSLCPRNQTKKPSRTEVMIQKESDQLESKSKTVTQMIYFE